MFLDFYSKKEISIYYLINMSDRFLYLTFDIINPNLFKAYYNWGIILDKQKIYDEAILMFKKTLKLNPDNSITNDVKKRILRIENTH